MFYNSENKTLIEETPPRVTLNKVVNRFEGRTIFVRRLKGIADLNPVISASTEYLNHEESYDKTGLYFVGALLVYKRFTPDTLQQKVIVQILKKIIATVVKHIEGHQEPGKTPMVCSQFIAQCYEDAGENYKLQMTKDKLTLMSEQNQTGSLLDQVMASQSIDNKENEDSLLLKSNKIQNETFPSDEDLCEELKNAFSAENRVKYTSTSLTPELIETISDFGHVHNLLNRTNGLQSRENSSSFEVLKEQENMFVTPGDLMTNCSNLQEIGVIEGEHKVK